MFTQRRIGKLIAGASAMALAGMGLIGVAAASADEVPDIIKGSKGQITVHKSSADQADPKAFPNDGTELTTNPGDKLGLDGVEFTLQPVLYDGKALDLSTDEGWKRIDALDDTATPGTALPEKYSLGTTTEQTTAGGKTTFADLGLGLYLVTETDSGDNLIQAPVEPFYVTVPYPNTDGSWNYDVHVYPKNKLNTIDQVKTVDDTALILGDKVTWTLTTEVPASSLPYKSYTLTDNLSENLKFISWGAVSIGGEDLIPTTDYIISADNKEISLTAAGLKKLDAAGETTVTATLVTEVISIPTDGQVQNTATVKINGKEDSGSANTNLGTLKLEKKGEDGTLLSGAVFELYTTAPDAQGNATSAPIATGTTKDGVVEWKLHLGIDDDLKSSYWVKETKAPAGYVLPANPWSGELEVTNGSVKIETITNYKPTGPDLPLTGASGTVLFTIAGVGLMAAAGGAVLVKRRRSHS